MLTNPENPEEEQQPPQEEAPITPPATPPSPEASEGQAGPAPIEETPPEPAPPPPPPPVVPGIFEEEEKPPEEEGLEEAGQPKTAKNLAAGLGAIFIGVVLITALTYFFIAIQNSRLQNLATSYDSEVKTPLAAMKEGEEEVFARADQITTFKQSLSNLVLWSELLKELTSTTYKKAKFTALNVSEAGEIKVDGEADNFIDLGKTIQAVKASKRFKEVELSSTGINADSGKVNFSLGFKINLQSLTKEQLKLSVPKSTSAEVSTTPAETIPATETPSETSGQAPEVPAEIEALPTP